MAKKVTELKKGEKRSVIIKPRMTEKSALQADARGVYAFNVTKDSTKKSIAACIKAEYKVTPASIRMVTVPSKKKFVRGRWGVKGGGKKAYVYLKKGDKIDVA